MTKTIAGVGTFLAVTCMASTAQADPGQLVGIPIDTQENEYGYWEYLPTQYDEESEPFPVIIFLSGIGENGDGTLPEGGCNGPGHVGTYLCRNLRHGPQSILWEQLYNGGAEMWDDEERPFVVISPQNPAPLYAYVAYESDTLDSFLDYVVDTYNVDTRRLYIAGMSMGGYSTLLNLVDYPDRYAAGTVMPGINVGVNSACNLSPMNLWAFHGENDGGQFNPDGMASFVNSFQNCPGIHPTPKFTLYSNTGHNAWTQTFEPTIGMVAPTEDTSDLLGFGTMDTDPYDMDIYSWLLLHDKPVTDAGPDFEVAIDAGSFDITATTIDDDPISYTWTQIGGADLSLSGDGTATLSASDLALGTYSFRVLAVDADQMWDRDEITVEVVPAAGGSESESESESDSDAMTGSSSGEVASSSSGDGSSDTGDITTGVGSTGLDTDGGTQGGTATASDTDGGSESASASDSASDSDTAASDTADSDTAASASASDSDTAASASASDSAASATATAGEEGSSGSGSDGDSGSADDGGGCTVGATASRAPLWMLGLFGLGAIRRRRRG